MTDPDVIYLEPKCCADPDTGRCWCEDDIFYNCEDGHKATKYVRADLGGKNQEKDIDALMNERDKLRFLLTEIRDLTVKRLDHAAMDEIEAVMLRTLLESVLDDIKEVLGEQE
jgi:hypothetical protein